MRTCLSLFAIATIMVAFTGCNTVNKVAPADGMSKIVPAGSDTIPGGTGGQVVNVSSSQGSASDSGNSLDLNVAKELVGVKD